MFYLGVKKTFSKSVSHIIFLEFKSVFQLQILFLGVSRGNLAEVFLSFVQFSPVYRLPCVSWWQFDARIFFIWISLSRLISFTSKWGISRGRIQALPGMFQRGTYIWSSLIPISRPHPLVSLEDFLGFLSRSDTVLGTLYLYWNLRIKIYRLTLFFFLIWGIVVL